MATLLTAACVTAPQASLEDRTLRFGCNDIVVVGSLKNGAFEPVEIDQDLLGHGWVSATLNIRKLVRGTGVPRVLHVAYFAHTYMREGRDFMLVLARAGANEYRIKSGQLMSLRPLLASRCD